MDVFATDLVVMTVTRGLKVLRGTMIIVSSTASVPKGKNVAIRVPFVGNGLRAFMMQTSTFSCTLPRKTLLADSVVSNSRK